jgi:hypothetical protein
LAALLQPKGPGYYESIPKSPSIRTNTKPLSFDIKPYSLFKFIYGFDQKPHSFYIFFIGVWQLLGFVGNLENGV